MFQWYPVMVFAGIWLACLLYIFIDEIIEIISVIRNAESRWHRALIDDYLGFWNIVYWLSISVAAAVIAVWLSLAMETGNLQSQLGQMVEDPSATTSVDQVATFYDALGPRNNLGRWEMFSIGFVFLSHAATLASLQVICSSASTSSGDRHR